MKLLERTAYNLSMRLRGEKKSAPRCPVAGNVFLKKVVSRVFLLSDDFWDRMRRHEQRTSRLPGQHGMIASCHFPAALSPLHDVRRPERRTARI